MILSDAAEIVDFLQNRVRGYWPEEVVVEWIRGLESVAYDIGYEAARQLANDWTRTEAPPWGKMVEYLRAADRRATVRQEEFLRGRELPSANRITGGQHLDWLHDKIVRERAFGDLDEMIIWQRQANKRLDRMTLETMDTSEIVSWFEDRNRLDTDLYEFYGMERR